MNKVSKVSVVHEKMQHQVMLNPLLDWQETILSGSF